MHAEETPRKRRLKKSFAGFGAAMSALAITPMAHGAIIDLTANLPGPLAAGGSLSFDFVGGPANDLFQFNDGAGKSIIVLAAGDIGGIIPTQASSLITATAPFAGSINIAATAAGTVTYGFLTQANEIGWLRMNLGGAGQAIVYLAAAFNDTPGEAIHAGTGASNRSSVPEPSSMALAGLGLLALGARGVRRTRKRRAAA